MSKVRLALALCALGVTALYASAAGANESGFKTSQPAMFVCPTCEDVVPLITVGETMPGGYLFESIPDGIAVRARGQGRADLFVNHETSTVPFPYNPNIAQTDPGESQNDFVNSEVSHLVLNQHSAGILSAKKAIPSSANYQRFCTNYMATEAEGFDRPILFANEEAQDWVFRTGTAWPGPGFLAAGTPGAEQAGVTAAYDVRTGKYKTIYGMGRLNHENTVAVPVDHGVAVLTTDDTFFTTSGIAGYPNAWSQLYMYTADSVDDLWNDRGDLWAFVSDNAAFDDYYDFDPTAANPEVNGHFIKVPKHIARGKHQVTGAELLHSTSGLAGMLPPPSVVGAPPDGPQWVLDQWGNANMNAQDGIAPVAGENVFRFVRLEDVAYDKRPGKSNIVYMADSGRAQTGTPQKGRSTNGRVWKLVLDPSDPTQNAKLSILIEGDDNPVVATNAALSVGEIHQPDNVETTANGSLFIQEDPSSGNQYSGALLSEATRTSARMWRYDLNSGTMAPVARIATDATNTRQLGDEVGDDDPDDFPPFSGGAFPLSPGNLGAWESSGIVDASSVFGPGVFLVTVQAHTFWVDRAPGTIDAPSTPAGPDFQLKREGGQLLLIRKPGW
ncbi:MAG TPA: hypothetical protein VNJ53_06605 [Gaiellaceae bacterium]|nr:hypothetical protein [Gaiellaceae bacterium]